MSRKTMTLTSVGLLVWFVYSGSTGRAGDLNPPAAPGSTMKPLDQVEPRTALVCAFVPIGADYRILIQQPGTYYLTEEISGSFRHAIKITASDVTLDLNGFRLYSSWTPPTLQNQNFDGIYIADGCENIEIRNGSIVSDTAEGQRGFRYGVYAEETCSSIRLSNLRIVGSHLWGIWLGGSAHEVRGSSVRKNGSGIYLGDRGAVRFCEVSENTTNELDWVSGIRTGAYGQIVGSRVFGNGTNAPTPSYAVSVGQGSIVSQSIVSENGEGCGGFSYGISAAWGSVVSECTVSDNGISAENSVGISADNGSSVIGCVVYYNGWEAISTSAGIVAAEGCTLKNNTVDSNGWSSTGSSCGIFALSYCLLDGNVAFNNMTDNIYTIYGCVLGLNVDP